MVAISRKRPSCSIGMAADCAQLWHKSESEATTPPDRRELRPRPFNHKQLHSVPRSPQTRLRPRARTAWHKPSRSCDGPPSCKRNARFKISFRMSIMPATPLPATTSPMRRLSSTRLAPWSPALRSGRRAGRAARSAREGAGGASHRR